MKDVAALFVFLALFLPGRVRGLDPRSGYCAGLRCFTVSRQPGTFWSARDECAARGGHLMTVRTPETHDLLFLLLASDARGSRFWIGLHLPSGCPDSPDVLRGYEWVTEDRESDFSNWAPDFDSGCSPPPPPRRCVSVSQEGDYKWAQEPCEERASGFLCEHAFRDPCPSLALQPGESVSYTTPFGFGAAELPSLPPGTTAIKMPAETKYVCFSQRWLQAPWSCEISEGGCEHKCAADPNNVPACYCPRGQAVNPANGVTCETQVTPDDPCLALRCAHVCYEEEGGGGHACACDHGYQLAADGRSCVDFNDCTDERQCPGENFMCVNTVGGFQCVCQVGYKASGELCVDRDECAEAPCEHTCANTEGSYKCACFDGYKEDPKAPNKCELYCGKAECPAECDPNDRFQCYCPKGYVAEERGDSVFCLDMNECDFFYCDQDCDNTYGGYECACSPGYTLVDEYRCVKSDDEDAEEGGSGTTTTGEPATTRAAPLPLPEDPTKRPSSGVTPGGLVGIIVCTVLSVVLLVFVVYHVLNRRGKVESDAAAAALKAPEGEAHGLHRVTSDA